MMKDILSKILRLRNSDLPLLTAFISKLKLEIIYADLFSINGIISSKFIVREAFVVK